MLFLSKEQVKKYNNAVFLIGVGLGSLFNLLISFAALMKYATFGGSFQSHFHCAADKVHDTGLQ